MPWLFTTVVDANFFYAVIQWENSSHVKLLTTMLDFPLYFFALSTTSQAPSIIHYITERQTFLWPISQKTCDSHQTNTDGFNRSTGKKNIYFWYQCELLLYNMLMLLKHKWTPTKFSSSHLYHAKDVWHQPSLNTASVDPQTWNTRTPVCATARLSLVPSRSLAGWRRIPYISNRRATSSNW